MPRIPLTACIITKDEERSLPACLESVSFADEIIVVDSHSKDATRRIASEFRGRTLEGAEVAPRVIERDWPGHVEQKNFAIDQASNEWVLALDADERVTPELRSEIVDVISGGAPPCDGYSMPRRTWYLGRWILSSGWYPDRKLRLFRRSKGRWGGINPHDRVRLDGREGRLRGHLDHYSYRDISDHVRKIDLFTGISAREKAERGTSWGLLRLVAQPPLAFLESYVVRRGFREGTAGFIVAALNGYYVFLKYAKLWELRIERRRS